MNDDSAVLRILEKCISSPSILDLSNVDFRAMANLEMQILQFLQFEQTEDREVGIPKLNLAFENIENLETLAFKGKSNGNLKSHKNPTILTDSVSS